MLTKTQATHTVQSGRKSQTYCQYRKFTSMPLFKGFPNIPHIPHHHHDTRGAPMRQPGQRLAKTTKVGQKLSPRERERGGGADVNLKSL